MAGFLNSIGNRLAFFGFILGLSLMWNGWQEFSILSKTKDAPAAITAAELSKAGPPKDNAYIRVTDYDVNPEFVYITKDNDDSKPDAKPKYWDKTWLEIMPRGQSNVGKPIVVKAAKICSQDEVDQFYKQKSLVGIVLNGLADVSPKAAPTGMHFPDIDADKDWIIEPRTRPDLGSVFGWLGAGLLLVLFGGFRLFRRFSTRRKPTTIASSGSSSHRKPR